MKLKKKVKKTIYNIILVIAILVFLFSAYKIGSIFYGYYMQDSEKSDLIKKAKVGDNPEKEPFEVDWEALKAMNEDIVGWILIPDTNISYPIVQGRDNDYYLTHTAEKKELYSGAIFMDADANNGFQDRHTIIYGHNVLYGTMFAQIEKFKEEAFYKSHPYVYIFTPEMTYRSEVFGVYTTNDTSPSYTTQFPSDEAYQQYLNMVVEQRDFESGVSVEVSDQIITLSTCSYERKGEPSDLRYLLQAKLVPWNHTYIEKE